MTTSHRSIGAALTVLVLFILLLILPSAALGWDQTPTPSVSETPSVTPTPDVTPTTDVTPTPTPEVTPTPTPSESTVPPSTSPPCARASDEIESGRPAESDDVNCLPPDTATAAGTTDGTGTVLIIAAIAGLLGLVIYLVYVNNASSRVSSYPHYAHYVDPTSTPNSTADDPASGVET